MSNKGKESNQACNECEKNLEDLSKKVNTSKCCCSCSPQTYDYVESAVCKEEDIKENEMKLLPLGDDGGKILLIKQKGELHAIGTKCTHYGALLHTGALGDGRIRCPWHGACFNIKTGDIEDYPGLDSLPCYKVTVDDTGLVRVKAKRTDLESNKRVKEMCKFDGKNTKTAVIIGGGPAGATCAESLRQEGFTGRIVMVCKEKVLPYDRVKVSKAMDINIEKILLRSQIFYNEHKIETKLGIEATGLDTDKKTIKLSNNEILTFDHLFICTGCKPRMPMISGVNIKNIFGVRNYTDAQAIKSQLAPEKHVVILGFGFIAMEAAAYCVGKCASVTLIGRDSVPLRPVFGEEIGERIKRELEEKGIKFIFKNNIAKFIPKEEIGDTLKEVELLDGTFLQADIAIIGIGSMFNTDWLSNSSIQMLENGSIVANKYLQTNIENIYVGGDIAYAPVLGTSNICAAIGHYPLAHYHGKIAALNICKKVTPLNAVPFFWTILFGKSYRYAGYGEPNKIKIFGSLEKLEFFAYYLKDDKVIAMSSAGADPVVADFANLLQEGKFLTENEINQDPHGWMRNKPKDLEKRFQPTECSSVIKRYVKSALQISLDKFAVEDSYSD